MDTTFCVDADSGYVQWKTVTGGGDSPPSSADVDGDGLPEVMHGTFYGNVKCLNGQTGAIKWNRLIDTNAAIESEPTIVRNGTELDFAVATWDFTYDSNRIACYRASDQSLKWSHYTNNLIYHGPAAGDLFRDGQQEMVIGDYDAYLYCIRSSDGALLWKDSVSHLLPYHYIGAPVTLADLNNDGYLDIVYMDGYMVRVVDRHDSTLWTFTPPGDYTNFRGAAIADVNHDGINDVTFCTDFGTLYSLSGLDGSIIRSFDLYNYAVTVLGDTSSIFEVDNAPVIADFDHDGLLDLFIVGGKGRSDSTSWNDYGYAFCLSWGDSVNGAPWTMFRHDERRTGCYCDTTGVPLHINSPVIADAALSITPDPVSTECRISFPISVSQNVAMQVTNTLGEIVLSCPSVYLAAGQNKWVISRDQLSALLPGVYFVRVSGADFRLDGRFLKQ